MATDLHSRIKRVLVENLELPGFQPEDIGDDQPLFGEGLGLDSVDALELLLGLEHEFGFKSHSPRKDRKAFRSVNTLAEFVQGHLDQASRETADRG